MTEQELAEAKAQAQKFLQKNEEKVKVKKGPGRPRKYHTYDEFMQKRREWASKARAKIKLRRIDRNISTYIQEGVRYYKVTITRKSGSFNKQLIKSYEEAVKIRDEAEAKFKSLKPTNKRKKKYKTWTK